MNEHNYKLKIDKMIANGELPMLVGMSHIHVQHDDWCGIFSGKYCNCDPDITYTPPNNRVNTDKGNARKGSKL